MRPRTRLAVSGFSFQIGSSTFIHESDVDGLNR